MFLVNANSQADLENLIAEKADSIILAPQTFSARQNSFLDNEQLADTVSRLHRHKIHAGINLLKMLEEQELEQTWEMMSFLKEIDADEIYIADEGWIVPAEKYGMKDRLIYQPETLMVNGYDSSFYRNLGFKSVSMAHELTLDELKECAKVCPDIEVLIQGRYSWMSSRRKLISNYLAEIDQKISPENSPEYFLIKEQKRTGRMPVVENENGTVVFSDEPICSYDEIEILRQSGIDRFRIDTIFEDENYGADQLRLYRQILNHEDVSDDQKKGTDQLYSMKTVLRKDEAK